MKENNFNSDDWYNKGLTSYQLGKYEALAKDDYKKNIITLSRFWEIQYYKNATFNSNFK